MNREIRVLELMCGGLRILQDPKQFCFGIDAVLLSGYVPPESGGRLLDLGTGSGILPLLLSAKTECSELIGLEIQSACAELAAESVAMNGLSDRISIVKGDIREADAIFAPASFDIVTANPPYIARGAGKCDPSDPRAIARHELLCSFRDVARAASVLLKKGGHFYLVHRPDRLAEILGTLTEVKLTPARLRMVHPFADRPANMLLLDCVRGGRSALKAEPPLIVYESRGVYTREVRRIYGET